VPEVELASVPLSLSEVLTRDSLAVATSDYASVFSSQDALEEFGRFYDVDAFGTPTVYVVTIERSEDVALAPGTEVFMIHIAGVEQEIAGPAAPAGEEQPPPVVIQTDMFGFVDAETGQFIATTYIGPAQ
jgi:hypothetical protein